MLEPDPNMSERQLAVLAADGRPFGSIAEYMGFVDGYEAALLEVRAWAAKKLAENPEVARA